MAEQNIVDGVVAPSSAEPHVPAGGLQRFSLPCVHINPTSWGPTTVPERYEKVPFATFNKFDRLGKCADFGGFSRQNYRGRFGRGEENVELTYKYDVEEAREFSRVEARGKIVSTVTTMPTRTFRGGYNQGGRGGTGRGGGAAAGASAGGLGTKGYDDRSARVAGRKGIARDAGGRGGRGGFRGGAGGGGGRGGYGGYGGGRNNFNREASVNITADWLQLESVELPQLKELSTAAPAGVDLRWAGALAAYDEEFDRVSSKAARKLRTFAHLDYFYRSTQDDPVMAALAQADDAPGNVYATDAVLTHIMTCARSTYPWDIVITYLPGGIIFLDHREPYKLEALTVSETAHAPPSEDEEAEPLNCREKLTEEATYLHQAFSQQVLLSNSKPTYAGPETAPLAGKEPTLEPNPYFDATEAEAGHAPAAVAYRYRRFDLPGSKGGEDIRLVARTTVNAVTRKKGSLQYVAVATLNEWDHKAAGAAAEWRRTADAQRGTLLAAEIKNNAHRVAKFTLGALLAGADTLKIGLVSRAARTDADSHAILGVTTVAPASFAATLALHPANAWGVLRWLVDTVRKHARNLKEDDTPEDEYVAKFVLLRDPNKPAIYLYNVAPDAFDRVDEREADDEGGGDGWGAEGAAEVAAPAAAAGAAAGAGAGASSAAASGLARGASSGGGGGEEDDSPVRKPGAKGS